MWRRLNEKIYERHSVLMHDGNTKYAISLYLTGALLSCPLKRGDIMPFRAKSFSNAHYHRERLETMEEDDKLASFILATNWSRGQGKAGGGSILRTQTFDSKDNVITVENRQLESHLDCVAVTWVEDRWYVASNRIKLI